MSHSSIPPWRPCFPAFNAVMNDYAGSELGYKSELPYVIWNFEGINRAWDWGTAMDFTRDRRLPANGNESAVGHGQE